MKDIKRIISLLMPYKGWLMFNIFSNLMVAFFMVFSIPALIPFFRLLFGLEDVEPDPVPVDSFSFSEGLSYLKYQLIIQIETHGRDKILLWLCIMLVSIFFLKNIFRYLSMFALAPLRNGVVRDLRAQLFDKLCYLNTGYFSDEKKGNLMARFSSDTNEIESSILNVLEALFRSPIVMAGSLLYMIYVSPTLTIYVLVMVVVVAWLIGRISRSLRRQSSSAQEQMGMILAQVEESISGQKITKAFNAENHLISSFNKANNKLRSTMNKILWRRDLASPISEFFGICVLALLLWKGSKEVFYSGVDPSLFLTFLFAFYNVIDPAKQFANGFFNVKKGLAALDRIETVLHTENPIKELASPISIKAFEASIRFENVSFQYLNSDQKVLDTVNLEIPKGYKIALVGPSGAGKSTLVDLIPRFYDVTAGRILIDGEDIRNMELKSLRNLFGLVTQEAFLFNDTIYNNIVFGKEGITVEDVEEAAQMAFAHDFIIQTELGYDTIIGDRGVKLSGGQRQRITIARALLKNPPIFLLDEATSALDTASEKIVQQAIDAAMQNRTAVIIAHRLSTIQNADLIFVMKNGQIIESGNHHELMSFESQYKAYVEMQFM